MATQHAVRELCFDPPVFEVSRAIRVDDAKVIRTLRAKTTAGTGAGRGYLHAQPCRDRLTARGRNAARARDKVARVRDGVPVLCIKRRKKHRHTLAPRSGLAARPAGQIGGGLARPELHAGAGGTLHLAAVRGR